MSDLALGKKIPLNRLNKIPETDFGFTAIGNDLILDRKGFFSIVVGKESVVQAVLKILITRRGSHPELPEYGSNLHTFIGKKLSMEFLSASIREEIVDTLTLLQAFRTELPPEEQLENLTFLKIVNVSPSELVIELEIETKAKERIRQTIGI